MASSCGQGKSRFVEKGTGPKAPRTQGKEAKGNGRGWSCEQCGKRIRAHRVVVQKKNGPKGGKAKFMFGLKAANRFFKDVNPFRISDENAAIRIQKTYRGFR